MTRSPLPARRIANIASGVVAAMVAVIVLILGLTIRDDYETARATYASHARVLLQSLVAASDARPNAYAEVQFEEGTVLAHLDPNGAIDPHATKLEAVAALDQQSARNVFGSSNPLIVRGPDGRDRLFIAIRVNERAITLGTPTDAVFAASRQRSQRRVIVAVLGSALFVLLAFLTRRMATAIERLEEANRLVSDFVAHVSHELRTPLHGILGFTNYLSGRPHGRAEAEALRLLRVSGQQLLGLVNALLDLAKLEAGHFALDTAPVDVALMVSDLVAAQEPRALEKGLALGVHLDPALAPRYDADGLRLASIFGNLLDNAVKFTGQGRVDVALEQFDSGVAFTVTDSGPGIASEDRERIFERFYRAGPLESRAHAGAGIGLALVRKLTRHMGGEIAIESPVGGGTRFIVRLPLVASAAPVTSRAQAAHA